jgi:hypothetical protein
MQSSCTRHSHIVDQQHRVPPKAKPRPQYRSCMTALCAPQWQNSVMARIAEHRPCVVSFWHSSPLLLLQA